MLTDFPIRFGGTEATRVLVEGSAKLAAVGQKQGWSGHTKIGREKTSA